MKNIRLFIISFLKFFIVKFFSKNLICIGFITCLLFPIFLIQNILSWKLFYNLKRIIPNRGIRKHFIRYCLAQVDMFIWVTLIPNAYKKSLNHNDFTSIDDIRKILSRNKGLLLVGMHYGPMCIGYVLHQNGFNPAILSAPGNIPDLDKIPFNWLLPQDYIFRGEFEGILRHNHSEKRYINLLLAGRPGMIMIDGTMNNNIRHIKCLGVDFPIGVFSFKLSIKHSFPFVVIWFSKIKGGGYRLNLKELNFNTIEDGVSQYGALQDKIITKDPYRWHNLHVFAKQWNR